MKVVQVVNSLSISFDEVNRPDPGQDIRPYKVAQVLEETEGYPEGRGKAKQGDDGHGPWARPAPFQKLLHDRAWMGLTQWRYVNLFHFPLLCTECVDILNSSTGVNCGCSLCQRCGHL